MKNRNHGNFTRETMETARKDENFKRENCDQPIDLSV